MMKSSIAIAILLLLQTFASAQQTDSGDLFHEISGALRSIGGHFNIVYDGERLKMFLVTSLSDKNSLANTLMRDKDHGGSFSSTAGELKIGDQRAHISFSSSNLSYEIHDHRVQFRIDFDDIPCVVSEAQSFDILMIDFSPDSATFISVGNESIRHAEPKPDAFTPRQARWLAIDTNHYDRHCEYMVELAGSSKGAFGFSRLSLRRQNEILLLFWEDCLRYLLIVALFWYVWYLLMAGSRHFKKIDPRMVCCAVTWIPWLAGFYLVIIMDRFVESCGAWAFIKSTSDPTLPIPKDSTTKWRVLIGLIVVSLWIIVICLRKRATTVRSLLIKVICKTLSWSLLVFLLMGAVNQLSDKFLLDTAVFHPFGGYVSLEISARLARWIIWLGYGFLGFILLKILAFNRRWQVAIVSLTLLFAIGEYHGIVGPGQKKNLSTGMSFTYAVKDIGEATDGTLDLCMAFWKQANQFCWIPLLLAINLVLKQARQKDEKQMPVIMINLFSIFFCWYLVNSEVTFLLVPITLLWTILLYKWMITPNKRTRLALMQTERQIYALEQSNGRIFKSVPELRQSARLKEIYHRRLLKGDMLPADYQKAVSDLDTMAGGTQAQLVIRRMEFGPFQKPLRNARYGLVYGAVISTLAYLVYFKLYLVDDSTEIRGLPEVLSNDTIKLLLHYLSPILNLSLAGFCLGYFFPFLKGKTGWEKGAWLGSMIGLARLPILYCTGEADGFSPVIGIFFKQIIICTVIGFLAFDLRTIRKLDGRPLSGKTIVEWMGWKRMLTLGTFVLAAIATGMTAWIAGNVQELLKAIFGKK